MKKAFLVIVVVIIISIILYGVFAFTTWELNPKYWDAFLRGVFSIILMVIIFFCVIGAYYEIKD